MFTQDQLEAKSGPELVAIFNDLDGVSPVKRFRTREAGVQRILGFTADPTVVAADPKAIQAALVRAERGPTPAEALAALDTQLEEDEASLATESTKREPKVRGVYNLDRKDLIRTFRPNSRRGRLIAVLLGQGATFDALLANTEVGFNKEDVLHKTIRILNWWTGYGISTDENGIITLTD